MKSEKDGDDRGQDIKVIEPKAKGLKELLAGESDSSSLTPEPRNAAAGSDKGNRYLKIEPRYEM
jgi:hypothetical protein